MKGDTTLIIMTISRMAKMLNSAQHSSFIVIMLNAAFGFCYAECGHAQSRHAECRSADCRYAECRGKVS
jgi:hypothetical protein